MNADLPGRTRKGMTAFDPKKHPRGAGGLFTETTHPVDPDTTLEAPRTPADRIGDAMAEVLDWDTNVSDHSPADWDHTQDDFSPLSEDTDLMASISEAAAAAIDAGEGLNDDELREKVMTAIAGQCGDEVTVCTRVWEAWSYDTMGPDDFVPLAEDDDVLGDLADAAIKGYREESAAA